MEAGAEARRLPEHVRKTWSLDKAKSAGIFIGVRSYEDPGVHEVPYAVDDAVDLAFCLGFELDLIPPDRIVLALSGKPQKGGSIVALQKLLEAGARQFDATVSAVIRETHALGQVTGPDGFFVFAFCGHGITDEGQPYLLTRELVLRRPVTTSLHFPALLRDIGESQSKRRWVLLDACRSHFTKARAAGDEGPLEATLSPEFHRSISAVQGAAIFAGTTPGGSTYDEPSGPPAPFRLPSLLPSTRPRSGQWSPNGTPCHRSPPSRKSPAWWGSVARSSSLRESEFSCWLRLGPSTWPSVLPSFP